MFRLMWLFFRVGTMNELQYRVNFFIQLFESLVSLGIGLVGLALVFSHTPTLDGWSLPQLLAVLGVYTLMGGLIKATIQPNMQRLLDEIQQGTLDYALTKPADSQVIVSVREVRIWETVDFLVGAVVLMIAVVQLHNSIGVLPALLFAGLLVLGGLMIYCFWLIITTGAFWLVRMDNVLELFQGVYQAGRWPVNIYPEWLQIGLTFLVPIAFAVTIPADALTGRLTWQLVAGAAALTLGLLVFARWFWWFGLRHYSGASA
ncbi:MAG TPA: ABC-2 family transporter protein [Ktedonobacterales bacterium]|jgi:ABC-2 type transport system permease protein